MTKRFSNWSLMGFVVGIFFIATATARYWFAMGGAIQDIDKFVAYTLIGILIFAVSWLYNKQMMQGHTLDALEDFIADKNFEQNNPEDKPEDK